MSYLRFECGARIPRTGRLEESFALTAKRAGEKPKRNGRYKIIAYETESGAASPRFEDGRRAPCMDCPNEKGAGRKEIGIWDNKGGRKSGILITCYPEEVFEDERRREAGSIAVCRVCLKNCMVEDSKSDCCEAEVL